DARLEQRAAHVHAGGYIGKHLDCADINARVADGATREDQPAALNVEFACVGGVFALLDVELAGCAGDLVVATSHRNVAGQSPGGAGSIDTHTVGQAQSDRADDFEALQRVCLLLADDHLV